MAVDAYMMFQKYDSNYLDCESTVDFSENVKAGDKLATGMTAGKVFELDEWSELGIEQTLNIGSQGGGTGAGRVDFKEFSFGRKIDKASPEFFAMACSGTPFKNVTLGLRKAGGGTTAGFFFAKFSFKLAAVKTVSWSHDDTSPKEEVTIEYGGLFIQYAQQKSDGTMMPVKEKGWDRTKNIAKADDFSIEYKA